MEIFFSVPPTRNFFPPFSQLIIAGNVELESLEDEPIEEEEEEEEEEANEDETQEKAKQVTFDESTIETGLKKRRARHVHEMIATGGIDLHLDDPAQPYVEFDPAPYQTPSHTPMVKVIEIKKENKFCVDSVCFFYVDAYANIYYVSRKISWDSDEEEIGCES
jgi:hypothetical protein